jgi:aminopeptidase-like protein
MTCAALDIIENDCRSRNTMPMCESQLGRRGLYSGVGGKGPEGGPALLWVLNLADERSSLLDTAERAKMRFAVIADAAKSLQERPVARV